MTTDAGGPAGDPASRLPRPDLLAPIVPLVLPRFDGARAALRGPRPRPVAYPDAGRLAAALRPRWRPCPEPGRRAPPGLAAPNVLLPAPSRRTTGRRGAWSPLRFDDRPGAFFPVEVLRRLRPTRRATRGRPW